MPEQILLMGGIELSDPNDDGSRELKIMVSPDRAYLIPLPAKSCETIGSALIAPSVVMPDRNGHG